MKWSYKIALREKIFQNKKIAETFWLFILYTVQIWGQTDKFPLNFRSLKNRKSQIYWVIETMAYFLHNLGFSRKQRKTLRGFRSVVRKQKVTVWSPARRGRVSTVVCRGKRLRGSLMTIWWAVIIASKLPLGVGFWRRIELLVNWNETRTCALGFRVGFVAARPFWARIFRFLDQAFVFPVWCLFLLRGKRFVEWRLASDRWSGLPFVSFRRRDDDFE